MELRMKKISREKMITYIVDTAIWIAVGLFAVLCFLPFLYVLTYSITPYKEYIENPVSFLPRDINFKSYVHILSISLIQSGLLNSIYITVITVIIHVIVLLTTAYPLSKSELKGRSVILFLFVFTMFFRGGMIPDYFLMRKLGLLNSLWSLIFSLVISSYNLVLMRAFIMSIPQSLEDSAIMDGANHIQILYRIIAPLSKPAIATFSLFMAASQWNQYFRAILYITERTKWPLQLVLREILIDEVMLEQGIDMAMEQYVMPFNLKMTAIIITIVPILCVYPFLQKYFMKGIMLGALKG